MVGALLSEASPNICALFLDDGSLVGNRFGCTYVADKLLDCVVVDMLASTSKIADDILFIGTMPRQGGQVGRWR